MDSDTEYEAERTQEDEEEDDEEEGEEEEEEEEEDDEEEDEDGNTVANNGNVDENSVILHATPTLPSLSDPAVALLVREIGHEAVWSLSTAKPGNGVTQLRDSSMDTYWQSDGGQPHLINIQFPKRADVCEVAFYLDYGLDESYTPKKFSIRSGMTFHDLVEIKVVELNEPVGWCSIPLHRELEMDEADDLGEEGGGTTDEGQKKPIRAHFVQICVASMHQNGRDTHIRQVKIFGPRSEYELSERRNLLSLGLPTKFQTTCMTQFSTIR